MPARHCSRSKRDQSTPIASPTRFASSVVVRCCSVMSPPPRVRENLPMDEAERYVVRPIGVVRSTLRAAADAPNQAFEGAPEALLEIDSAFAAALHRLEPGGELLRPTCFRLP